MIWTQVYSPVAGNLFLSALVAALPVFVLLGLLAFWHVKAHISALLGLVTALLVSILVYRMPAQLAGMAAVNGALYGLLPIGWIVLNAIFIYDISVKSGDFEVVKHSIAGLAADRRIQALLIAYSFGAFIEGAAGFGTPVAISAAMLIGLGFKPLEAAGLALIGNTAPVAYGALGSPLIALAGVTGLPLEMLSAAAGRILPLFSLMVPFWIIWTMAGRKAMLEVWPACLTAGGSFAICQFLVSNYHGPWLVDIAGAIISMVATIVLLKFWQPKNIWRYDHEKHTEAEKAPDHSAGRIAKAWMPWVFLSIFVFAWGTPQVKTFLNGGTKDKPNFLMGISKKDFEIPKLHKAIVKAPPVVAKPSAEPAVFTFNWLSATGTSLLLAGIVGGLFLGFGPLELLKIFGKTIKRVKISLLTIAAMLALGFTTKSAGLDATMGLAFAATGALFPFFSAMLGWLGVALTGSDTSSNVLFGGLQKITAQQLGLNPIITAAANTTGGVMGKMIDAQSLVVASVATGQEGEEGTILRYVFLHSIVLAALVGIVVFFYAKVLPAHWMPQLPAAAPAPVAAPAAAVPAPVLTPAK
ncbi:L-lactate permease [Mesoterricola sediminis]|uniref:L-lactate permease n=1 Tax=Mesoterricola sediminis TaxID=2927980 RepID=A0AA48KD67_9BACT|nr:L-lactate permease [Mesoterricola sediminis]BDU77871.1 L-lactate permease [Mesoterricola sediminis]